MRGRSLRKQDRLSVSAHKQDSQPVRIKNNEKKANAVISLLTHPLTDTHKLHREVSEEGKEGEGASPTTKYCHSNLLNTLLTAASFSISINRSVA